MNLYNGWTPEPKPVYATKTSMIATRDLLLKGGFANAAAALDNAIELIAKACKEDEEQAKLCDSIVADVEPELMRVRYAIASAIIMPIDIAQLPQSTNARAAFPQDAEYFEWTCQACGMRLPSTEKGCPNCGGRGIDGCGTGSDLPAFAMGR